jgi:hypothetical protein
MPLRVFDHGSEVLDEDFFIGAIHRAASLRREVFKLDAETEAYRAIHADADQLPGLVADKFGKVMSLEVTNGRPPASGPRSFCGRSSLSGTFSNSASARRRLRVAFSRSKSLRRSVASAYTVAVSLP